MYVCRELAIAVEPVSVSMSIFLFPSQCLSFPLFVNFPPFCTSRSLSPSRSFSPVRLQTTHSGQPGYTSAFIRKLKERRFDGYVTFESAEAAAAAMQVGFRGVFETHGLVRRVRGREE